jgi:hypothetical protein
LLEPCHSIEETIADLTKRHANGKPTICVLPEGPVTIAYVKK